MAGWAARIRSPEMTVLLVQTQDVPILLVLSASLMLIGFWMPAWRLPSRLLTGPVLMLIATMLAALLAWGTYALMGNFPLSRDEHMVVFDMAVFDQGRLAAPVAPSWRPYALAMVPNFLLNSYLPSGLVSAYLPMNAMLRLAFSKVADPVWFNPLLLVAGGIALFDIAKRVFSDDQRACYVTLLVYALSAQILVTAMTTYSMTGHLALNLIWLAAFLRGGKAGNSVALAIGFVATGLHQLIFHPFFIAPFLLWRLREGEWRRVLVYGGAYLVFIGWWAVYPLIVSPMVKGPQGLSTDTNFITEKLIPLLRLRDPRAAALMVLNLLRFFAWQNLALIPLLLAAAPLIRRDRGFPAALALGIVMWLLFLTFILPEQGRGYGYRYLHGYLGNFALLAGIGYRELERRIGPQADGMVLVMSGLTLVTSVPALLVATYAFMQPHLAMERFVAAQRTPFILVDDNPSHASVGTWANYAVDYVRNLPDTNVRPLRFSAQAMELSPGLLASLCGMGPVTLITKTDMYRVGLAQTAHEPSPKFDELVSSYPGKNGCYRPAQLIKHD